MPDWDTEQRIRRLWDYATWHSVAPFEVVLKFRFLSKSDGRDGQVYLGNEYEVIDKAFEGSGFEPHAQAHYAWPQYNRHESGPEILSLIADTAGVTGGAVAVWSYVKARIDRMTRKNQYSFQGAKYTPIEVRAMNAEAALLEKQVALIALTEDLDQKSLMAKIDQALANRR